MYTENYLGQTQIDWLNVGGTVGQLGVTTLVATGLMTTGVAAPVGAALMAGTAILQSIGIRKGANEADAIVPVQNAVGQRLKEINAAIDRSNIQGLQQMHAEVIDMARQFRDFVSDPRFTDGRASEQALDTLMPLVDGTDSTGSLCQLNLWGDPCNGGTLGTIERRIYALGGTRPPMQPIQGYGSMISNLQYPIQDFPFMPQAGTLPPTAPLSPIRSAGISGVVGGSVGDLLPFLLLGGIAFTLYNRRR